VDFLWEPEHRRKRRVLPDRLNHLHAHRCKNERRTLNSSKR
jgi:hypothetical protein